MKKAALIRFKKPLIAAAITVFLDFLFHFFLTHPMETLTYFTIKFLLAFFVAALLFSLKSHKKLALKFAFGLIFSTLMSTYYRAWELFEAYAPFGFRAPDIIGISRDNLLLFSGTWWIGHALFFTAGVFIAEKIKGFY